MKDEEDEPKSQRQGHWSQVHPQTSQGGMWLLCSPRGGSISLPLPPARLGHLRQKSGADGTQNRNTRPTRPLSCPSSQVRQQLMGGSVMSQFGKEGKIAGHDLILLTREGRNRQN